MTEKSLCNVCFQSPGVLVYGSFLKVGLGVGLGGFELSARRVLDAGLSSCFNFDR